jgi:copper ion binding protein
MPVTTTFEVAGMSCQHCVDAVEREVGRLDGVAEVEVDLAAGSVTIVSDAMLDEEAVRAAVDEAGYDLVGAR